MKFLKVFLLILPLLTITVSTTCYSMEDNRTEQKKHKNSETNSDKESLSEGEEEMQRIYFSRPDLYEESVSLFFFHNQLDYQVSLEQIKRPPIP